MATATRKRATKKKAPAKKRATKTSANAKANGAAKGVDKGPLDFDIKSEVMRFKLKALQLEWEREDVRVRQGIQQKLNDLLARAQRNDPAWKKANEARLEAADEAIAKYTESLPPGYCISKIELAKGTYRATFDPENRGKVIDK